MPEGDTVFRTARALDAALAGSVLVEAQIRHPRLATVELAGRTVLGVVSVGKHLFIRFDGDARGLSLHSHLRMDGSWRVSAPGERWRAPGHQVRVVLTTARSVAIGVLVHDLALLRTDREDQLVGHLGPDLLGADWDDDSVAEAVSRLTIEPSRELGIALLDQTVLAGVGNVYRSEVCFLLGTSPWTPVSAIDPERAVRLCHTLLLRNATRPVRSTTGDTTPGRQLWVYRRGGRPCLRCGTPVRSAEQGRDVPPRVAWFCPTCQPGPRP
ncbi:MAG TPA: DNA-formamidopyrimidine glycosylase family protein [Pseudonocardiaceae bacterium]|nr:DNA-formamidopyrimidine glycosylase family protein [Pseudonocardiaceae bacterium]